MGSRKIKMMFCLSASVIALAILSGCATVQKQTESQKVAEAGQARTGKKQEAASGKQETPTAEKTVSIAPAVEEIPLPSYEKAKPEKQLPPVEPIDYKKLVNEEKPVMLNADSMPLSDFIVYAIGDTLKVTFFIDEPVRNLKKPVTLRMTKEMPADKVLEIAVDILRQNDLVIEERAGSLYILKSKPRPNQPASVKIGRTGADSPASIIQIVPLAYARASEIAPLIQDLYKTNVTVKQYPSENALLLNGPASAINDILGFIDTVDVPYFSGKKVFLLHLTYWQPEEFVKQLKTILEGIGYRIAVSSRDAGILFIPVKFLNSVLVVSPDDVSLKVALDWKNRLDTVEAAGTEEKAFTYTPKFAKATDMVDSLRRLYAVVAPAGAGSSGGTREPAPETPARAGAPAQQRARGEQPPVSAEGLKVAADDKRNIILISATPSQYRSILTYLEKLDVPPKQVLIEATIAELTLTDELDYGFEWFYRNRIAEGNSTAQTLGNLGLATMPHGLFYNFITDSGKVQAQLDAFASKQLLNIISRPRLMVIDNQEATIQIGTDVPIVTSQISTEAATTTNPTVLQSVTYRTTGTILKIKPNVNTEGLLTVNISEEESQPGTTGVAGSPLISTTRVDTTVVAASGQGIFLGGLMSVNDNKTDTKVPLLGDIPLIGNLFKSSQNKKVKTELIILITPTIISDTQEATRITDEISSEFKWVNKDR